MKRHQIKLRIKTQSPGLISIVVLNTKQTKKFPPKKVYYFFYFFGTYQNETCIEPLDPYGNILVQPPHTTTEESRLPCTGLQ